MGLSLEDTEIHEAFSKQAWQPHCAAIGHEDLLSSFLTLYFCAETVGGSLSLTAYPLAEAYVGFETEHLLPFSADCFNTVVPLLFELPTCVFFFF